MMFLIYQILNGNIHFFNVIKVKGTKSNIIFKILQIAGILACSGTVECIPGLHSLNTIIIFIPKFLFQENSSRRNLTSKHIVIPQTSKFLCEIYCHCWSSLVHLLTLVWLWKSYVGMCVSTSVEMNSYKQISCWKAKLQEIVTLQFSISLSLALHFNCCCCWWSSAVDSLYMYAGIFTYEEVNVNMGYPILIRNWYEIKNFYSLRTLYTHA